MKKQFYPIVTLAMILFSSLFFCYRSAAQTYRWKSVAMGGGGFVSGIVTSRQQQNLMYCRTDVGGAYRWDAVTGSWIPLLDWASATQDGFYGVESLAIDPQSPNKLYMYVGINYFDNGKTAILKSDDYGQTFTTIDVSSQFKAHGNGMGRSNGERLQVDPNLGSTLYVGTRYNGIWKSTNAGLNWSRLNGLNVNTTPNGNGISFVVIDPTSGTAATASQTLYVGISRYDTIANNLYKSTDGGNTFSPVTGGPTGFMPQRATLTANGDLVMTYANGSGPYGTTFPTSNEPMGNGGIWKYSTAGGAWTNITPSGVAKAFGGVSVDPGNPNRIIASTINNYQLQYGSAYGDRIYLSTNGGASWTDVVSRGFNVNTNGINWILGQAIHWAGCVEFDPFNGKRVFITSGNGFFTNDSIDIASAQWKFDVKGLEETVPLDMVSLPGGALFSVIGDYDGFKHTDITQYAPRLTPTMGSTSGIAYAGNNPNVLVRVGSSIYYTTDQGATWIKTPVINGSQGKVTVSADGSTMLHSPNGSTVTYYSKNNGATWTASTISVSSAVPVADMVNSNKIYIYNSGSGNFNVSNDAGASFAVTTNIGTGGSKIIRTVPGKEGHIWVALYGGGLKRSVNGGTSFTTLTGVQSCSAIGLGKAAAGATYFTLYMWGTVSGVTGVFRSVDEGATWLRLNDDAHQFGGPGNGQFVVGDMNTFGTVYMSTVGRGVVAGQDISQGSLPVSLTSLNLQETDQNGRHVARLNWQTLSENNSGGFTIERSTDGLNWTNIATVPSKAVNGNSNASLAYTYQDDLASMTGLVYYRLKMTDKNSRFTYGNVVSLNIGKAIGVFSMSISPNPVYVKSGAIVRLLSGKDDVVLLKIVSSNGTVLSSRRVSLQTGSTSINIADLVNISSGTYALQVVSSGSNRQLGVVRFVIR